MSFGHSRSRLIVAVAAALAFLSPTHCEAARVVNGGKNKCLMIAKLTFVNKCSRDITITGWEKRVEAGSTNVIGGHRSADLERLGWRFDGAKKRDFFELNANWIGPGTQLCGHPCYSNYNGFYASSKYEAFVSGTKKPACEDYGAEFDGRFEDCPGGADQGWCKGSNQCGTPVSKYIQDHAWAINSDSSKSKAFKWTKWGVNYVNHWCPFPMHNATTRALVATQIGCFQTGKPIDLQVTTCSSGDAPPAELTAAVPRRRRRVE